MSSNSHYARKNEQPKHIVELDSFLMSRYEIKIREWEVGSPYGSWRIIHKGAIICASRYSEASELDEQLSQINLI